MAIFGVNQVVCSRGRSAPPGAQNVRVVAESGGYKVLTPFNRDFVNSLKIEIPATSRKWSQESKAWYVSETHGAKLKELIDRHYGVDVQMPTIIGSTAATVHELTFKADYIGNSKAVAGGAEAVSSVHCNGGWNARIPEKVLRAWFNQSQEAETATGFVSLYSVLGCGEAATAEEIKKAYKRAARQWHPDVCKEPEAREMFEKVKEASTVLLDPVSRAKYNAGLFFEKLAKNPLAGRGRAVVSMLTSFTPLLRCGLLKVKGRMDLGLLVVDEILAWDDITNEFGQTMVSFWAGDTFSVMWV
jgi:hypothetical protein